MCVCVWIGGRAQGGAQRQRLGMEDEATTEKRAKDKKRGGEKKLKPERISDPKVFHPPPSLSLPHPPLVE